MTASIDTIISTRIVVRDREIKESACQQALVYSGFTESNQGRGYGRALLVIPGEQLQKSEDEVHNKTRNEGERKLSLTLKCWSKCSSNSSMAATLPQR